MPMHFTEGGIWLPTPLDVMASLLSIIGTLGILGRFPAPAKLLEAGTGDGRWVAALGLWSLTRAAVELGGLEVYGLESDSELFERTERNLERVSREHETSSPPWRVARGSYLDPESYRKLGLELPAIDIFWNYPDGNERELAELLSVNTRPEALLCLLTPDSSARADRLHLEATHPIPRQVTATNAPDWSLRVYRVGPGAR